MITVHIIMLDKDITLLVVAVIKLLGATLCNNSERKLSINQ